MPLKVDPHNSQSTLYPTISQKPGARNNAPSQDLGGSSSYQSRTLSSVRFRSTYASTAAQSTPRIISAPCPRSSLITESVYCSRACLVLERI